MGRWYTVSVSLSVCVDCSFHQDAHIECASMLLIVMHTSFLLAHGYMLLEYKALSLTAHEAQLRTIGRRGDDCHARPLILDFSVQGVPSHMHVAGLTTHSPAGLDDWRVPHDGSVQDVGWAGAACTRTYQTES